MNPYPPMLAVPFWPTAPLVPAPKFVAMPNNVQFVPAYSGTFTPFGDYGATQGQKRRWTKRIAKLEAEAKKLKAKGGDRNLRRAAKKLAEAKKLKAKLSAGAVSGGSEKPTKIQTAAKKVGAAIQEKVETLTEGAEETETSDEPLPAPDVPTDAAAGSSNMTLIIGGTVLALGALGFWFYQQNKRKRARSAAETRENAP